MTGRIVLLSGHVCAGKTTLARRLADIYGVRHLRTSDCLVAYRAGIEKERQAFQALGESLDKKTKGAWVRDGIQKLLSDDNRGVDTAVVVDAVRIPEQIDAIRESYGRDVIHIHLEAPEAERVKRYGQRLKKKTSIRELSSYAKVLENKTERRVDRLRDVADVVIDTTLNTIDDVVVRTASHVGLYGRNYNRNVDVLVGGQYGSEGKGQIAAYLSSEYDILVRVGGPNAGHTVYEEPAPYTFHHLPSGSRVSDAQLVLGPGAVLYVPTLLKEIADCSISKDRLSIDPQAMIISESDRESEEILKHAIGSTKQGVGAATARKILDRSGPAQLARDVPDIKPFIRDTSVILDEAFRQSKPVLLEGTQGTGLSLHHGYYPHVTSRDTTVAGCLAEAGISPSHVRKVVMVCRTYPIRVQNPKGQGRTSGPMSIPISWKVVAQRSGIPESELRKNEKTSTTRRSRRVSEFDWCLLRKAASLNAPTDIALTFADYIRVENREARRFDQLEEQAIRFIEEVERVGGSPVSMISTRFHSRSIIDRRSWSGRG